jgi:hypothetical protein
MSIPEAPPPEVSGRELSVIGRQLGRAPRDMSRVAARCPYGQPVVVECLPADLEGRPFPTLYYCTCPTLVAAVGARESAGGVRIWAERLTETPALSASLAAAVRDTRQRREDLVRSHGLALLDAGASLTTGVGGVADTGAVKCLHAHVAHALACPGYRMGEAMLVEIAQPWCGDRRCDSFATDATAGA